MSAHDFHSHPFSLEDLLDVKRVDILRPFSWLAKAWQDILNNPATSLAHGLIVSSLAFVVLLVSGSHLYIFAAALSGFTLIGPVLAAGLCEMSKGLEKQQHLNFDQSLNCFDRSEQPLMQYATLLLSISVFWFLLSALLLSIFVGKVGPTLEQSLWGDFFNFVTPLQITLYVLIGGLLASFVFIISVVSIPAIVDKNASEIEAIKLSIDVFSSNLPSMLIWALLILALTFVGFASFLVGMVLIYPLLGHASWHAYRDLVTH